MLMKLLKASILLIGLSLMFSSAALAGDPNKGKLHLQNKTIVDGKPLNPGYYSVEWTGTGPTVQVTLLQGKQTVATFPAHITVEQHRIMTTPTPVQRSRMVPADSLPSTSVESGRPWN
jgi:hypothetical protein